VPSGTVTTRVRIGPGVEDVHTLADGATVVVRCIRPADRDEVRRGYRSLSPTSRYRRFFAQASDLSDQQLTYLCEVDGKDHLALVAVAPSHDQRSEMGLGVARFVRLKDDPRVAEAAVTVLDDHQRRGIGRLLLGTLAEAALERGIDRFRVTVLGSNAPIRHVLDVSGGVLKEREDDDSLVYEVPLRAPDASPDWLPYRLLREAASSLEHAFARFRGISWLPQSGRDPEEEG
jgi:GNAT superfamily N-acetyltransferase